MRCKIGSIVGYSVRFEECFDSKTKIKFVTEGLLVKEWLLNPQLKNYSTLIIDEAHERSSNTDIILSLIRNQIILKLDIKIILMSATIDTEKFSQFLFNCPVFSIPGRCFSIKSFYSRITPKNFLYITLKIIFKILKKTLKGNILIFLRGKKDIDKLGYILFCFRKNQIVDKNYEIFPLFSELSTKNQIDLIEKFSIKRKIILATNVAEASITLSNVKFVIDNGISNFNFFDPRWNHEKITSLPIHRINSYQRSGRTGRTTCGRCFRLYTKWSLKYELGEYIIPEIKRIDISSTILFFKSIGLKKFNYLQWLDSPSNNLILTGLKMLYLLGAINKINKLTVLGRKLVELPLKPMLGKSLLISHKFDCKKEILYFSCISSISNLKINNQTVRSFNPVVSKKGSDHLIYAEIFKKWKKIKYTSLSYVKENRTFNDFKLAENIEFQLLSTLKKLINNKIIKIEKDTNKALLSGFFLNTAKHIKNGCYSPLFSRNDFLFKIHPQSSINDLNFRPNLILFDQLYFDVKIFMKIITIIKIESFKKFSLLIFSKTGF